MESSEGLSVIPGGGEAAGKGIHIYIWMGPDDQPRALERIPFPSLRSAGNDSVSVLLKHTAFVPAKG